jgi:hypothetical protein
MGKRVTIIIAAIVVLGVAFFLLTATQKQMHAPIVSQPAVAQ